ncbi:hypothetical protein [Winogradskyella sp. 4-2091]|uniref:hypothetical protein n=1 Tax=Winogradskyella sp. 4-2091 TaxID=3381659 RepID=UPI003891C4B8
MKKVVYLTLLSLSVLLINSCDKDSEDKDWAENFVGSDLVETSACEGTNNNNAFLFNVDIIKIDETTLSTRNLLGYGISNVVEIDVISANEISINYTDVANRVFTGTGTKVDNELTIDIEVDFPTPGLVNDICTTVITY